MAESLTESGADPWRERGVLALTAGLAAVACLFVPHFTRDGSHLGRAVLAVLGIGFVLGHLWLVRGAVRSGARLVWRAGLVAVCVVGIGNYYQFNQRVFTSITDYTDIAYYWLNSKYFEELSYYGLYAALIQSDRERGDGRTDHIRIVRDLSDYELRPAAHAQREGRRLRDNAFTEERWRQFGEDGAIFLRQLSPNALETNFFVDHGYNPPPTWTLLGGAISESVPVNYAPTATHVDTVLVAGMFGCVAWAFGFDVAGLCLLWFLCTFSGRWPILGQSLLRFDWLAAVVGSVCMLRKGHPVGAGVGLAYAALNRVFPVIFAVPLVVAMGWSAWREGGLRAEHRRLLVGAGVTAILLLSASFAKYGPATFQASVHNLWMHNQTYSSHRVGLGDVLVFRGETTREQINAGGGIAAKEKRIHGLQWPLRGVGLLALGLVALAVIRSGRREWETVGWAALPLFCVTNAQVNYWNLRLLLVLWHMALLSRGTGRRERAFHALGLGLLFGCEVLTQSLKVAQYDRYTVTTSSSYALLIYFALLATWLAMAAMAAMAGSDRNKPPSNGLGS